VPDEQMHPYLLVECPRITFPFLRRIVSDVTRDGGFPPLNLETIDFVALYRCAVVVDFVSAVPNPNPGWRPPISSRYTSARISLSSSAPCNVRLLLSIANRRHSASSDAGDPGNLRRIDDMCGPWAHGQSIQPHQFQQCGRLLAVQTPWFRYQEQSRAWGVSFRIAMMLCTAARAPSIVCVSIMKEPARAAHRRARKRQPPYRAIHPRLFQTKAECQITPDPLDAAGHPKTALRVASSTDGFWPNQRSNPGTPW